MCSVLLDNSYRVAPQKLSHSPVMMKGSFHRKFDFLSGCDILQILSIELRRVGAAVTGDHCFYRWGTFAHHIGNPPISYIETLRHGDK